MTDRHRPGYYKEWGMKGYMKRYRKKNAKRIAIRQREYNLKNKEKNSLDFRKWNLWRMYKLTLEDYANLEKRQKSKCAICKSTTVGNKRSQGLYIDHCHTTKKVRGLLCHKCNSLLGHAQDNIDILKKAIKYLEMHE